MKKATSETVDEEMQKDSSCFRTVIQIMLLSCVCACLFVRVQFFMPISNLTLSNFSHLASQHLTIPFAIFLFLSLSLSHTLSLSLSPSFSSFLTLSLSLSVSLSLPLSLSLPIYLCLSLFPFHSPSHYIFLFLSFFSSLTIDVVVISLDLLEQSTFFS